MKSDLKPALPAPRRGEIWTAYTGDARQRHRVLIVSLDTRNLSGYAETVLVVPFSSRLAQAPTTIIFEAGETGLPGPSCLRGHFISTIAKSQLIARQPRPMSDRRMREVCSAIRRAYDPDAPFSPVS
jgi:mRNA-degrading endonuclease toxin of MazEF toxin-antitoxin module